MNSGDDKEQSSFKIKDNRRFDSDGNLKSDDDSAASEAAAAEDAPSGQEGTSEEASSEPSTDSSQEYPDGPVELSFSSFVMSLATQVLMQLGELAPPEGVQLQKDVAAAKQTIDILSMLKVKTEGNLNEDEARLMEEILHNLRMSFVRNS